jgi:ElaB/YqjD/DUF883 family membrane-anchored ribosome-binding protein
MEGDIMIDALRTRHGSIEGSRQALVKDLEDVAADANELMKQVAISTGEEFATARTAVEARLSAARSRVDGARIAVGQGAVNAAHVAQAYVVENPWRTIGYALVAAGLLTTFLSRRR